MGGNDLGETGNKWGELFNRPGSLPWHRFQAVSKVQEPSGSSAPSWGWEDGADKPRRPPQPECTEPDPREQRPALRQKHGNLKGAPPRNLTEYGQAHVCEQITSKQGENQRKESMNSNNGLHKARRVAILIGRVVSLTFQEVPGSRLRKVLPQHLWEKSYTDQMIV